MFGNHRENNEQLDRLGTLVLRAVAVDEQELEQLAASPFLFTRIRARVAESRRQDEAAGWQWLPNIARRAVPAMALVAALTGGVMLWSAQSSNPSSSAGAATSFGMYEEALSDTTNPGVEQMILSRNNLSPEEVFTIVVDRSEREQK